MLTGLPVINSPNSYQRSATISSATTKCIYLPSPPPIFFLLPHPLLCSSLLIVFFSFFAVSFTLMVYGLLDGQLTHFSYDKQVRMRTINSLLSPFSLFSLLSSLFSLLCSPFSIIFYFILIALRSWLVSVVSTSSSIQKPSTVPTYTTLIFLVSPSPPLPIFPPSLPSYLLFFSCGRLINDILK